MAKNPESNTSDGFIMTTDDGEVIWDGEADQLGLPSLVGKKSPIPQPAAEKDEGEETDGEAPEIPDED